jgi:hypothetical protein
VATALAWRERAACGPFEHLTLPTLPTTAPGEGSGFAVSLPTKWVTQLLYSGNSGLIGNARAFERGQADNQTIRAIQSECNQLGA